MPPASPAIRICYQAVGSRSHAVVQRAVEELVLERFGRVVSLTDIGAAVEENGVLLAIDADEHQPVLKALQDIGRPPDFHLAVSDLAIDTGDPTSCDTADVVLLKDGIRAACTVTSGPTPAFNCPCCG